MSRLSAWALSGAIVGAVVFLLARRAAAKDSERFFAVGYIILTAFVCSVSFFLCAMRWKGAPALLGALALTGALFHSLTDLSCGYIYDGGVWLSVGVGAVVRFTWHGLASFGEIALGALSGWGPIALIIFLTRGGMGWGDALMMLGLGALLGWRLTFWALYFGMLCAGLSAIIALIMRRVGRRDSLPLAPFLWVGVLAALVFAPQCGKYLNLIVNF